MGFVDPLDLVPGDLKERAFNRVIERVAKTADQLFGPNGGKAIRSLRTDRDLLSAISRALSESVQELRATHGPSAELEYLEQARDLWESEDFLQAMEAALMRPGTSMPRDMFERITVSLPFDLSRDSFRWLLEQMFLKVAEKVWSHPALAPVYQLHMHRITTQTSAAMLAELRGLRQDSQTFFRAIASSDAPLKMVEAQAGTTGDNEFDQVTLSLLGKIGATLARDRTTEESALPLLPVPASIVSSGKAEESVDDIYHWSDSLGTSRQGALNVLLGDFGAGKSEFLTRLSQKQMEERCPVYVDYRLVADRGTGLRPLLGRIAHVLAEEGGLSAQQVEDTLTSELNRTLLLIDGLDEANLMVARNAPSLAQELKQLASLAASGASVIAAARPSIRMSPSTILRSVTPNELGTSTASVLELKPVDPTAISNAVRTVRPEAAAWINERLQKAPLSTLQALRRPLFIQMILQLPIADFPGVDELSLVEIYSHFVGTALARDADRGLSLIPADVKWEILASLASDMLTVQTKRPDPRLSLAELQVRIVEAVARDYDHVWTGTATAAEYHWSVDFLETNHVLSTKVSARPGASPTVRFNHQSFYEYFLSVHFLRELDFNGRFGLRDTEHSVRAFDSLLPHFMRASVTPAQQETLEQVVASGRLSFLDRLLALFLLEDSSRFRSLLLGAGDEYETFLHRAEAALDSFFMRKVVKYQLIGLDGGIGRALAYVSDLRSHEMAEDQSVEVHTFGAGVSPTAFLLGRLSNPDLANAMPITVYRLGQFGDETALQALLELREQARDPSFVALIDEATVRVLARKAEDQ